MFFFLNITRCCYEEIGRVKHGGNNIVLLSLIPNHWPQPTVKFLFEIFTKLARSTRLSFYNFRVPCLCLFLAYYLCIISPPWIEFMAVIKGLTCPTMYFGDCGHSNEILRRYYWISLQILGTFSAFIPAFERLLS